MTKVDESASNAAFMFKRAFVATSTNSVIFQTPGRPSQNARVTKQTRLQRIAEALGLRDVLLLSKVNPKKKLLKMLNDSGDAKPGKELGNAMLLAAKCKSAPLSSTTTSISAPAIPNPTASISSALPGHLSHLLAISEAMESVLATKRGGHVRQILFRADKAAVEKFAKRAFKVDHILQLKTLLGDSMELCWVPQALSKRAAGSTSAKDLDLAIRFRLPTAPPPSPVSATAKARTPSPVRGRSSTRRSITSSASTPPTEDGTEGPTQSSENTDNNGGAPATPVKASQQPPNPSPSPSMRRNFSHGCLRPMLFHAFAAHITTTNPSLAHLDTLTDIVQHSAWDAGACPEVSKAKIPTRPATVAAALGSSRGCTPVRNGSVATMLTPSPSIRGRRDIPGHLLPSPQVTPQSLMPPTTRTSPPPHSVSRSPSTSAMGRVHAMQTPPTKMLRGLSAHPRGDAVTPLVGEPPATAPAAADGGAVTPRHRQHSTCASRQMTPLKYTPNAQPGEDPVTPTRAGTREPSGSLGAALPCITPPRVPPRSFATPSQTPKRKRADDGSPTQSVPQTPASSRQPVRVVRTPAKTRVERTAAATPGRTPRKELVVRGSTASPHVRKAILAHARSPKFEGALPIVQMRVRPASPAQTPEKGVLRDVYGHSAHCASVPQTPASTRSTQSRVLPQASPMASKRAVKFMSPVADASAFYSPSPKGKSRAGPAGCRGAGADAGEEQVLALSRPRPPATASSEAAVLAASIMDDDMAELLQRNARSAVEKQVAQDPRTIRRSIEQEARKHLPAMYDQLRVEFERRHSLKMPHSECVEAVVDMGLAKAGLARDEAEVYLEVLLAAAPNWISTQRTGSSRSVCIARMCTGVRRHLEEVAHGYTAL